MSERTTIRPATLDDVDAVCAVLRRSICELCEQDHRNDPAILSEWLANKTPDNVAQWLSNPDNIMLAAERAGAVVGVGAVTTSGEISLNYVSPDAQFSGVSKAMVVALENEIRRIGLTTCTLTSTQTAHRFYQSMGYVSHSAMGSKHGTDNFPMTKRL